MTTQLALTPLTIVLDESPHDWILDEETREVGRRGVAEAREILNRVRERHEQADGHGTADGERRAA
jgi:hypothetical protein